ncbi:MAG: pyridoxal phosphate biosynthetic protein [Bdellovibrionales bacterium CG10_big_fil_rev_8_21_14_0_10_45_34]|nr:MAG: pyridoxal phosphate biosynthetic protein [Bdellovibrionales bacterium CG10_big_fil_rev_8_21_14_0_10_45_34]
MAATSKPKKNVHPKRIVITSGDSDGIGLEIAVKALVKVGTKRDTNFILFRSVQSLDKQIRRLRRHFKVQSATSWHEAVNISQQSSGGLLIDIASKQSPAFWFEQAALAAIHLENTHLVTAPLSKTEIHRAGMKDLGHTDILKRLNPQRELFMAFVGSKYCSLLLTEHIPLNLVTKRLSVERVHHGLLAALKLREQLDAKKRNKPIALLGINPHASEDSLIGTDEEKFYKPALDLTKSKVFEGPFAADSFFARHRYKDYSVVVSPYHDQGLVPFKLLHEDHDAFQLTLGLPFVRTSVDHGTAKDIFGKDRARSDSMVSALNWALKNT